MKVKDYESAVKLDELIDIRQSQQPLVEDVEKILLEKAFNTNPANREIFQKIRTDLEDFMMKSSTYKEQALAGLSRTKITSGRTDKTKITDNLDEFDQYFINHTLTRGNLKQFCHTHYITVPEPATGRIAKISECTVPINYGSINNVINQRKLLTGFPCAPRQTTVFNTNHVEEIHTLIMTTRN